MIASLLVPDIQGTAQMLDLVDLPDPGFSYLFHEDINSMCLLEFI